MKASCQTSSSSKDWVCELPNERGASLSPFLGQALTGREAMAPKREESSQGGKREIGCLRETKTVNF